MKLGKGFGACYVNTQMKNHGHDSKRLKGPEKKIVIGNE